LHTLENLLLIEKRLRVYSRTIN